jgi:GNAT superfamily N-acetyltransferase
MPSTLRIDICTEHHFLEIVSVIVPTFSHMPFEAANTGPPTKENLERVARNHRQAWFDHAKDFSTPSAIKCVHTDSKTGIESTVGAAYWFIYDRERTEEEFKIPNHLFTASWVEDERVRKQLLDTFEPMLSRRKKWMGTRPHGLLLYMAVLPEWRRQGASTRCVQWGIDRCQELGIPAYLEASTEGKLVYEKLGFEVMDEAPFTWHGQEESFPVMIKWPTGTKEEDKRPAMP